MEAKVIYKSGSIECHTVPAPVGTTETYYSSRGNSETSTNDLDDLSGIAERFYIDERGAHLERGRLADAARDWRVRVGGSTPGRNVIAKAEDMQSGDVVRITIDDEQVWPETASPENRVENIIEGIEEKLDALVL